MCRLEYFSFSQTQSYIGSASSEGLHIKTHQNEAEHLDPVLSAQLQLYLSFCFPGRKSFSSQEVSRPHYSLCNSTLQKHYFYFVMCFKPSSSKVPILSINQVSYCSGLM